MPLPNLKIPKRYREGVFKISQLDSRTVEEMCKVLNSTVTPSTGGPQRAMATALTSLSDANRTDFAKIADSLLALYGVKAAVDVSLEDFVGDIAEAMESLEEERYRVPEEQGASFREKLQKLLGAEAFTLSSKAQDLQTDDERTFCRARILTDLRPVFGANIEEGPKGIVIVHLLKLGFHQTSSEAKHHDEFYISLDADDLQTLKKVIERAEAKARILRSAVPNLPVLGPVKE